MSAYRKHWAMIVVLLAVAGCAVQWGSPDSDSTAPARGGGSARDVVTPALRDVERFWTATYPKLADGKAFKPVKGGYHPYTRRKLPPPCGSERPEYQPNAFYCPSGDFIAWDAQTLIPQLQAQYGDLLVGVVMAHEYGHAIQARLGQTEQPTVVLEQQADCFAGAWLADALAGRSTAFTGVTPEQLDNTVAGLLVLRDQPGTSAANPQAHGNAFDRIRALQDGVEEGAQLCATYRADNVPVTEVPFQTREDAANGGDLPYAQAVNALSQDAQDYWSKAYPKLAGQPWATLRVEPFSAGSPPVCDRPDASAGGAAFYCKDGDFAAFDNARLAPALYENIGDNAVGMLLGDLFARAAQSRRGADTQNRAGQLAVDCLAGSWTSSQLSRTPGEGITLSPGDLDEAVAALLAFGRAGGDSATSAFDRIGAYRDGVIKGLDGCSA
ncbi:neutral zinc metallopeptidase [Nucisporomicrobium flavum]|uniref:neutral zinc metallopeptidase n=1 Tax=Nucisporomicrobium flavum TaxID=2785915 RepID=UPI0027DB7586|nr:neutral zinc metallopeptidase [Nucisporomicrobium flavum]